MNVSTSLNTSKITILIVGLIVLSGSIFGQAKFYTNNGKTLVTELKPGMSDVKVVVPVPDEYSNHDLIEVAIDYLAGDDSRHTRFNYSKEYKIDYLKGKKQISIWIKSPGSKSGDFCNFSGCFKIDLPASKLYRNYTTGTVSVKLFGKDLVRYEWVHEKRMPVYKYSKPLSKHNVKMNYGAIIKTGQTEKGMFKAHKFFGKETISNLVVAEGREALTSIFASKREKAPEGYLRLANPIYFNIKDVTGTGVNNLPISIDYIKTGIILTLLHHSNPGSNKFIKSIAGSYYSGYNNNVIYMPMVMPKRTSSDVKKEKDAEKTKDMRALFGKPYQSGAALPKTNRTTANNDLGKAYEAHVNNVGPKLVWEKGKVAGVDVEMIKLKVYNKKQVDDSKGYFILKPGEEAKSKFVWYFIGEKGGKIFAGSVFRMDPQDPGAEEDEFIEKMMLTYEIK